MAECCDECIVHNSVVLVLTIVTTFSCSYS